MSKTDGIKITDVKAMVVAGNFAWPMVRIETNAGIYGLGEAFTDFPDPRRVKDQVLARKDRLIGQDPTEVIPLVQRLGLSPFDWISCKAISGIEMALWDITGKVLGVPVYKLLGGRYRSRVRIYCDCHGGTPIRTRADYTYDHPENYTPEAFAANARWIKSLGFTFLKFDLYGVPEQLVKQHGAMYSTKHVDYCTAVVKALREEIGWEHDLAIDYGGKSVGDAIRLIDQAEPYRLAWAEDIIRAVKTPTLTGELLSPAMAFHELIKQEAVRIVAPDMSVVGGINEVRKVAHMADLQNMLIAPHNICSPIGTMAAVHACSTMPNFVGLEFHSVGVPWWQDMVHHEGNIIDGEGYINLSETPGIGLELNEDVVREHLYPDETYFA
jgi:gluconate/galactonate dehydratase